ncbi:FecR family protein [Elongatibacter sediminis]|uniref:FecR domain-containing protein n=1 Tax=Elongatibacter sediminis TaxID=3119006 RepID=A0AAW9RDY6_9GAMM
MTKANREGGGGTERRDEQTLWNALGLYPVELDPSAADLMVESIPPRRFWLRPALAVAALAVLVVTALVWHPWPQAGPVPEFHQSGPAERLVVRLIDGSRIQLNANTRIAVSLDETGRQVTLDRGEALFDVAPDPARPFTVVTSRGEAQALGTVFDVALERDDFIVTVVEGRVRVRPANRMPGFSDAQIAGANEQMTIDARGRLRARRLDDLQPVLAWVDGKLVFRGERLAQAVERLNRHNRRQISIADPALTALPVYGVFNIGDTKGFVAALQSAYGIRAEDGGDQPIRLTSAGTAE